MKNYQRTIALFLSFLLIFTNVPLQGFAEKTNTKKVEETTSSLAKFKMG
jgi:NhaP-type Na+/H+ or K+/H+ antiporter